MTTRFSLPFGKQSTQSLRQPSEMHAISQCKGTLLRYLIELVWNVMAHAQKPDLVFQLKGRVHLNRRESHFSRHLAAELCASAGVMLDTPCSEVECKTTGYPLHSYISLSLPLPCLTVCHQVSTELYTNLLVLPIRTWLWTLSQKKDTFISVTSLSLSRAQPEFSYVKRNGNLFLYFSYP
jgi:hypothetical protein